MLREPDLKSIQRFLVHMNRFLLTLLNKPTYQHNILLDLLDSFPCGSLASLLVHAWAHKFNIDITFYPRKETDLAKTLH